MPRLRDGNSIVCYSRTAVAGREGRGPELERAWRIAAGSIAVSAIVVALKGAAWWLTGSAALYSDALESLVNVASAGMALVALLVAAMPADANHPYGHDKAELFAAAIEGALIMAAAVLILQHAWSTWQHPVPLHAPLTGTTCAPATPAG